MFTDAYSDVALNTPLTASRRLREVICQEEVTFPFASPFRGQGSEVTQRPACHHCGLSLFTLPCRTQRDRSSRSSTGGHCQALASPAPLPHAELRALLLEETDTPTSPRVCACGRAASSCWETHGERRRRRARSSLISKQRGCEVNNNNNNRR